jgi:very-short-patch-repair endonuclease
MFRGRYVSLRDHDLVAVLSVPPGNLAAMGSDLPTRLRAVADNQAGVVSLSQILKAGLTRGIVTSRLRRGSWQRVYPGVYAVFSGELNREAGLWAAVLYAGPGAMLSHQTAAELWQLTDGPSSLIHVTVPSTRRVRRRPGLTIHLSARAGATLHPARIPPRTRIEDTVIDLWMTARSLDEAVGWITSSLGRRLTTQDKLREAVQARVRLPRRTQLAELLSPDAAGIHSVLEYRYVRYVERPHGLVGAKRQVRVRRDGRTEYRDQLYAAYGTAVELDGRAAHPGDTRWKDIRRDNAAAALGITTLRYGWRDVTGTPCRVAAQIAEVLAASGYNGARPCSADCPVGRQSAAQLPARPRHDEQPAAACRVPARAGPRAPRATARATTVAEKSPHA